MDPIFELKKAVLDRLKATAAITALVATRIYDRVPAGSSPSPSPYISLGPADVNDESADCIFAGLITFQVDVYSWGTGAASSTKEATGLADLVKRALRAVDTLTVNGLATFNYVTSRVIPGPDGATTHVALTFNAIVEEA